jgi:uncharacterized protein
MSRGCGGCTICCRLIGVAAIGKPAGTWCTHCTATGCSIHPTRPTSCRNFECFWLMDEGFPEDLRPDRCGVVAAWNGGDQENIVLHVDPDRPDALARKPGSELVEALLRHHERIFVVCGDEKVMLTRRA